MTAPEDDAPFYIHAELMQKCRENKEGFSPQEFCDFCDISSATGKRWFSNPSTNIKQTKAGRVAAYFDVPLDDVGSPDPPAKTVERNISRWYIRQGLSPHVNEQPAQDPLDSICYQRFVENQQSIDYLWSDPESTNSIAANIVADTEGRHLRITYHFQAGKWPPNVSIHPENLQAIRVPDEFTKLQFRARSLAETEGTSALVVRIRDKHLRQWRYSREDGIVKHIYPLSNEWADIVVDLQPQPTQAIWKLLHDEHPPPRKPDFSVVTGIVLEVANTNFFDEPGVKDTLIHGTGGILVGPMSFRKPTTIENFA